MCALYYHMRSLPSLICRDRIREKNTKQLSNKWAWCWCHKGKWITLFPYIYTQACQPPFQWMVVCYPSTLPMVLTWIGEFGNLPKRHPHNAHPTIVMIWDGKRTKEQKNRRPMPPLQWYAHMRAHEYQQNTRWRCNLRRNACINTWCMKCLWSWGALYSGDLWGVAWEGMAWLSLPESEPGPCFYCLRSFPGGRLWEDWKSSCLICSSVFG